MNQIIAPEAQQVVRWPPCTQTQGTGLSVTQADMEMQRTIVNPIVYSLE
jgi:hypothetical protein